MTQEDSEAATGPVSFGLDELLEPKAIEAGVAAYHRWQDSDDYSNENLVRQIILAATSRANPNSPPPTPQQ